MIIFGLVLYLPELEDWGGQDWSADVSPANPVADHKNTIKSLGHA